MQIKDDRWSRQFLTKLSRRVLLFLFCVSGVFPLSTYAQEMVYPKKANYFLNWELSRTQATELAKWDLVILDMEIGVKWPYLIDHMRQLNPDIKIVAYFAPFEVPEKSYASRSSLRRGFGSELRSSWYLRDVSGSRLSFWPGTHLMNVSDSDYRNYTLDFIQNKLYASQVWDGVFFDNAWEVTHWYIKDGADLDRDGEADSRLSINTKWQEGLRDIYAGTRTRTDENFIILANGLTTAYEQEIDGLMIESLETHDWSRAIEVYDANLNGKKLGIVNNNTQNTGNQSDYRAMRFGLTSALLSDGFYSFDHGDQWHGQTWWYDEYDIPLGASNGPAGNFDAKPRFQEGAWVREFQNGVVLVNSSNVARTIELSQDFEKIRGVQDPYTNDGGIVSQVTLPAKDGIVMRKLLSDTKLDGVVHENGSFARFFETSGSKSRNGFFVFDESAQGGDIVGEVDVNGDYQPDRIHATANSIEVTRHDGQRYFKKFPYGFSYNQGFRVFVADMVGKDGKKEIMIIPNAGSGKPIKVYSFAGSTLRSDWYPFGSGYGKNYLVTSKQGSLVFGNEHKGMLGLYYQNDFAFKELEMIESENVVDMHFLETGELVLARFERGAVYLDIYDNNLEKKTSAQVLKTQRADDIDIQSMDIDFDGQEEIIVFGGGISF